MISPGPILRTAVVAVLTSGDGAAALQAAGVASPSEGGVHVGVQQAVPLPCVEVQSPASVEADRSTATRSTTNSVTLVARAHSLEAVEDVARVLVEVSPRASTSRRPSRPPVSRWSTRPPWTSTGRATRRTRPRGPSCGPTPSASASRSINPLRPRSNPMPATTQTVPSVDFLLTTGGDPVGGGTGATLTFSRATEGGPHDRYAGWNDAVYSTRTWSLGFEAMYIEGAGDPPPVLSGATSTSPSAGCRSRASRRSRCRSPTR